MTIRPAKPSDIYFLSEYWYDQMALLSQKSRLIRLAPNARSQWENYAESLIAKTDIFFFVAERENEILGAIIGRELENTIGLIPERYGMVEYLIVDMHSPHRRENFIGQLLNHLKTAFRERGLSHLKVSVAAYTPVEQGFWRGLGANLLEETFWMAL
jgi:GNAT superfamily N-acetyltransferase